MTVQYLPDNRYIPLQGLQTLFNSNLDASPLVGGTLKFFTDTSISTPKDVFILSQVPGPDYSFVDVGPVITLGAAGSPTVNGTDVQIYLFPYDASGNIQLYFIQLYDINGNLILTRHAQPPNVLGSQQIEDFQSSDNQILNPQFAVVNFPANTAKVFNVSGTGKVTSFAPDWSLVTNGTGTVTLTENGLQDTTMPTGAPFSLTVTCSAGITKCIIRQTIAESPRLFANGSAVINAPAFVYASLVANSTGDVIAPISITYTPSTGTPIVLMTGNTTSDGQYNTLASGAVQITSTNTDSPLTPGFVNIDINIPLSFTVSITSVQVVSVASAASVVPFIVQSVPQQINDLFSYYQPGLNFKPVSSLLTGWDFALNPAQWGTTQTITNSAFNYIWDQTIGVSTVANVNVVRSSTPKGFLAAVTTANNEVFYLQQFLSGPEAIETALSRLSVNVSAYASNNNVTMQVFLCNGNNSSTIPVLSGGNIGTVDVNGVITITAANWVVISQPMGQSNLATLNTVISDYGFSGFDPTSYYGITSNFSIIVTFVVPTSGTTIILDSISCVPGDVPTRPAAQTVDEVLRECQYYYENSYNGEVPGTIDGQNAILVYQNAAISGSNVQLLTTPFNLQWKIPKRMTPLFNLYSPITGTGDTVRGNVYTAGLVRNSSDISLSSNWSTSAGLTGIGTKNMYFVPSNGTAATAGTAISTVNPFGFLTFHYYADARLGIV